MMGARGLDVYAPDGYALPHFHLNNSMEAMARQEGGRAVGRDEEVIPAQTPQRRQMNVVTMEMGEQHGVDGRQRNRLG